ncbi:MAG: hypothetical protein M1831_001539 [Alyxoria varia]|nr:MAG: hypothetical protein M1831_001539 [Alyxoria varia]
MSLQTNLTSPPRAAQQPFGRGSMDPPMTPQRTNRRTPDTPRASRSMQQCSQLGAENLDCQQSKPSVERGFAKRSKLVETFEDDEDVDGLDAQAFWETQPEHSIDNTVSDDGDASSEGGGEEEDYDYEPYGGDAYEQDHDFKERLKEAELEHSTQLGLMKTPPPGLDKSDRASIAGDFAFAYARSLDHLVEVAMVVIARDADAHPPHRLYYDPSLPGIIPAGSSLDQELERLASNKDDYPGIYMQQLVDNKGLSPSPEQFRKCIPKIRHYAQPNNPQPDIQWIEKIDSWRQTTTWKGDARLGGRKYLSGVKKTNDNINTYVDDRLKELTDFLDSLEGRLASLDPSLDKQPLHPPLVEFGWTINFRQRLSAHRHHRNSNFIVNLFEAVLGVEFQNEFGIEQHVIYHCWKPSQACTAEVFFTRIGQRYIDNGGGFSHIDAALTNDSAHRLISSMRWARFQNVFAKRPHYWVQMKFQVGRAFQMRELDECLAELGKMADTIQICDPLWKEFSKRVKVIEALRELIEKPGDLRETYRQRVEVRKRNFKARLEEVAKEFEWLETETSEDDALAKLEKMKRDVEMQMENLSKETLE